MAVDTGRILIFLFGYFIVGVSLIPLIRNDNWLFRIFEYPRAQKLVVNLILVSLFPWVADWSNTSDIIFAGLLVLNLGYLFYQIYPYTMVARYQLKGQTVSGNSRHFKLLVCNVYQDNRAVDGCLATIRKHNPDIIILVETDSQWRSDLRALEDDYAYRVLKPLDNTYGMCLYSRLELVEPRIKYLVEEGVPSIHTRVKLPSGDLFFLYCLHPQPPVPGENPRSTERDAELLMIAKEARACSLPVIVAGDLNDVAWSYTTELFMKISRLLDPRRGRGFFNTFHAKYWYLRWPLDHVFCSKHFLLNDLKRLPFMGSDHFPILVELQLNHERQKINEREELHADAGDEAVAAEKISEVK